MAHAETSTAIYRDENKIIAYRGAQANKASIDIYSCAGKLIRRINVRKKPVYDKTVRHVLTDACDSSGPKAL